MNHEAGGSGIFRGLGIALRRGVVDLEEIGTFVAETCTVKQAIKHPGAVAKLYE